MYVVPYLLAKITKITQVMFYFGRAASSFISYW